MTARFSSSLAALGMVAAPALMKLAEHHPLAAASSRIRDADRDADDEPEVDRNKRHCGVERWAIKVGSDGDARAIDVRHPKDISIDALRALQPPEDADPDVRNIPTEMTAYVLRNVKLTRYKREGDSDYHVVIEDGLGRSVIAEIPEPGCLPHRSPWRGLIRAVRETFDNEHEVTGRMRSATDTVSLVGVGFFDAVHGQSGVAPNGIEIHPVLDLCFGEDCQLTLPAGSGGGR